MHPGSLLGVAPGEMINVIRGAPGRVAGSRRCRTATQRLTNARSDPPATVAALPPLWASRRDTRTAARCRAFGDGEPSRRADEPSCRANDPKLTGVRLGGGTATPLG